MRKKDDDRLQLRLENKLLNIGLRAPSRVTVEIYNGTVTLKGVVQYEYQKRAAIHAVRSMDGVRSFIDLMKVQPPVRQPQPQQQDSTETQGGDQASENPSN